VSHLVRSLTTTPEVNSFATTSVLGTEYGLDHGLSGVFHAVAGGHGHFKSGFFQDQEAVEEVAIAQVEVKLAAWLDFGIGATPASEELVPSCGLKIFKDLTVLGEQHTLTEIRLGHNDSVEGVACPAERQGSGHHVIEGLITHL